MSPQRTAELPHGTARRSGGCTTLLAAVPHSLTEIAAAAYQASDATETQSLQLDLSCLTLYLKYAEGRNVFLAVQFILWYVIKTTPLSWTGKLQKVHLTGTSTGFPIHSFHCTKISVPPYCELVSTSSYQMPPIKSQHIQYTWSATLQNLPVLNSYKMVYPIFSLVTTFLTLKIKASPSPPTVLICPYANTL